MGRLPKLGIFRPKTIHKSSQVLAILRLLPLCGSLTYRHVFCLFFRVFSERKSSLWKVAIPTAAAELCRPQEVQNLKKKSQRWDVLFFSQRSKIKTSKNNTISLKSQNTPKKTQYLQFYFFNEHVGMFLDIDWQNDSRRRPLDSCRFWQGIFVMFHENENSSIHHCLSQISIKNWMWILFLVIIGFITCQYIYIYNYIYTGI